MAEPKTESKTKAADKTKSDKPERTPEQNAERHVRRAIAKALSTLEDGTSEEKKARRTENKKTYSDQARKLIRALTTDGVSFQVDEAETKKAKRSTKKADASKADKA